MSEKKQVPVTAGSEVAIERAKDFWTRNSKLILGVGTVLLLAVAGYYFYKNSYQKPKEEKAADAMFKAEAYWGKDSISLALNGDGQNLGFLKIIDRFSGTDAANIAHFYAGDCYVKLKDNANAIKHLKKFSTDAKQVQQSAYKLLGDAYADMNNNSEAFDYYKKAAHHFEEDKSSSAEALFLAANLADGPLKNPKEAIALFTELKEKYPRTAQAAQADTYLAKLGVYNVN